MGRLRNLLISDTTRVRYTRAVRQFFRFTEQEGCFLPFDYVQGYIEAMWEDGEVRGYVADTLSGLQHFVPGAKGHLKGAWRLLTAWQRHELPARASPFSVEQAWGLVGLALRDKDVGLAAAYAISFVCFLRPAEILGLQASHCTFDLAKGRVVMDLGLTKGGKRQGRTEAVHTDQEDAVLLLALALEGALPGTILVPGGSSAYRRKLARHIEDLGLSGVDYKPYSMRRGGATHYFLKTGRFDVTMEKGRWRSATTARIYINEAAVLLKEISFTEDQHRKLAQAVGYCRSLLED